MRHRGKRKNWKAQRNVRLFGSLLVRRPSVLNLLHWAGLASPISQTSAAELAALERHAANARTALEIGSFQGVSAARIAAAMEPTGVLFCVDPWLEVNGKQNPCWSIFTRHIERQELGSRIRVLRGFSGELQLEIPSALDFAFIDGDHAWAGIETDWSLVGGRMRPGGRVCLHDSLVPPSEPWRSPDSVRYFEQVIRLDRRFELIDIVHSMAVLRRLH